jgi:hypothetical protein
MKICSESLKEEYYEKFRDQLRKMAYEEQGTTVNSINYNEPDIVQVIKEGSFRQPRHLFRMQEQNPCRNLPLHKP